MKPRVPPPEYLRNKPVSQWSRADRERHEPEGWTWDCAAQQWVKNG